MAGNHHRQRFFTVLSILLALVVFLPVQPTGAQSPSSGGSVSWVEPMRKVHARFTGKPGTFAHFGDSITVSQAFWSRLKPTSGGRRNLSPEAERAFALVNSYMQPECWDKWKGGDYGNGGPGVSWALDCVDVWLNQLNPEVVFIMFGSQDVAQLTVADYERKIGLLTDRCLANGSIVILATSPPRSGLLKQSKEFADAVHRVAREFKVPLVDFFHEVLKRRHDWDGTLPEFAPLAGADGFQVPTLIARDGVHPSNPQAFDDFSETGLNNNGYVLQTYLVLMAYAEVIREVMRPSWFDLPGFGRWVKQVLVVTGIMAAVFAVVFLIRYQLVKATARR
jgi:hypothetical protein